MASITSVVSLFVLLLATYCYSVPIEQRPGSSTPDYELTTDKTIVDHEHQITIHDGSDEESTGVPNIHKERTFVDHDSDELTTSYPFEHHEHEHVSRMFEDPLFTSSPIQSNSESHSSEVTNIKRDLDNFLFKAIESREKFEERAFPMGDLETELETSTFTKLFYPTDDLETTTDNDRDDFSSTIHTEKSTFDEHDEHDEHSSSVDSFGKMTGLLTDKRTEEKLTTSEHDQLNEEESTTQSSEKTRITKTEIIYPGKITKTTIYGEKQPVIEKEKPDY